MMRNRKTLAVDCNILRSASLSNEGSGEGVVCRKILEDILKICHKIIINAHIRSEYKKHSSRYSVRWLASMAQRGKLVMAVGDERYDIRLAILESAYNIREIEKDLPYVEAALVADMIFITNDRNAKKNFDTLTQLSKIDIDVEWIVPLDHPAEVLARLRGINSGPIVIPAPAPGRLPGAR